MNPKIGLFYGSSTCYTEIAGEKIQATLNRKLDSDCVEIFNIADEPIGTTNQFTLLILGIPTWDYGELQEDWENCWDDIDQVSFAGKKVALYGLGDQVGYPEWFQDALGYLHAKVVSLGATPVGYWPNQGYEYEQSKALTDDGSQFVGLALDDENEFEQTDARIERWCDQLIREFNIV